MECNARIHERYNGYNLNFCVENKLFELYILVDQSREFGCGGSLINSQYVVTAGHCVSHRTAEKMLIRVRLGEFDTSTNIDCDNTLIKPECAPAALDINIEQIIVHENYDPRNKNNHNDIGLLRLEEIVIFSDYISPICLPSKDSFNLAGVVLSVAGWGETEKVIRSNKKLKVKLTALSNDECSKKYSNSSITSQQFCAGGQGKKGSLFFTVSNKYYIFIVVF